MKKVCFVSFTSRKERPILDPSVRYRCYHHAEALADLGFTCAVLSADQFLTAPTYDYDVYVFHRPSVSDARFESAIYKLNSLGKIIFGDYDDLIFGNKESALESSIAKNKVKTLEETEKIFKENLDGLKLINNFFVSTEPLARQVRKYKESAQVTTVPNTIPNSIIEMVASYGLVHAPRSPKSLGYFCGTKSHDKDFPIVAEILYRVLCEDRDMSLLIVGPLTLPPSIAAHPRVTKVDAVGYLRLFSPMASCGTVIAPLEDTMFNDCKSRVKFLEAALTGCRLVASPIDDMRRLDGAERDLPTNENDWYAALSSPPSELERRRMAAQNWDYIVSNCNSRSAGYSIQGAIAALA